MVWFLVPSTRPYSSKVGVAYGVCQIDKSCSRLYPAQNIYTIMDKKLYNQTQHNTVYLPQFGCTHRTVRRAHIRFRPPRSGRSVFSCVGGPVYTWHIPTYIWRTRCPAPSKAWHGMWQSRYVSIESTPVPWKLDLFLLGTWFLYIKDNIY